MNEFKITKKFSLDFLGKDWKEKDAHINFKAVTIGDIKNKFPKFGMVDEKDSNAVLQGMTEILEFLKSKFISGKGIIADGSLVDLKAEDLENLPAQVLSRTLSFLSEGVTPISPKK